ncbi:MAG TPA: HAD family hydrolase [Solirubrobacteraceae bacterium]|jgi:phosphoglycolate phosphatase-like HAD superfamily hydrolase|nr:HAD family hydrolase [Solirubrobacteraceae bacterium]
MTPPAALLDIDGTLVDSNYQHALAWYRAFRLHGLTIPVWRCHRAIGMGGDQLVRYLAGDGFEGEQGDSVRIEEHALYAQMIAETQPFEGARGLIEDLKGRGSQVVIASSAKSEDTQHYLDLLDARALVDGWTDSGSVEATKPAPDLIEAAVEIAGGGKAVLIGDSTWDCTAAKAAKVQTICVRTGGFGTDELLDAGAIAVYESIAELREKLDETPFGT